MGAHYGTPPPGHHLQPLLPAAIGGRPSVTKRVAVGPVTVSMAVEVDYQIAVTYEVLR